jgi:hypothetical protein
MATYFKSNRFSLLVTVIVFLVIACNNKTDEKATETKDSTGTATSEAKPPITGGLTAGMLDTLFANADSVRKLPEKKLVFAFTFRTNDTLTIHGWSAEKDSIFTLNPDIELRKYAPSTVAYGTGLYFGNMVFKKKELKELQRQLQNTNIHSVLFAPKVVDGTHIAYDIFLSTENPAIGEKIISIVVTGLNINPSPPKTY